MVCARFVGLAGSVAVVALVGLLGRPVMGEPKATEKKATPAVENKGATDAGSAAASAETQKASRRRRPSHQLPTYYASVVDQEQRAKIYQIQDEYAPKIASLKAELESLTTERDTKVAAVLNAEQRAKVEAMKAEAKNKRLAKANGQQAANGAGAPTAGNADTK